MKKGYVVFSFAISFAFCVLSCAINANAQESEKGPLESLKEYFDGLPDEKLFEIYGVERITVLGDKFYHFSEEQDLHTVKIADKGNFVFYKDKYYSAKNELKKEQLAKTINDSDDVIFIKVELDCVTFKQVAYVFTKAKFIKVDNELNVTSCIPFASKIVYCTSDSDRFVSINREAPNVGYVLNSEEGSYSMFSTQDVTQDGELIASKGELIGKLVCFKER